MKKILAIVLTLVMVSAMIPAMAFGASAEAWDGSAVSTDLAGSGTAADPYLVSSGADLAYIANAISETEHFDGKYFVQTADIDLGGNEIRPIGHDIGWASNKGAYYFGGNYDGRGYRIANATVVPWTVEADLTVGIGLSGTHYPVGIFGGVSGSKIENVVADNIKAGKFGMTSGDPLTSQKYYHATASYNTGAYTVSPTTPAENPISLYTMNAVHLNEWYDTQYAGVICGVAANNAVISGCVATASCRASSAAFSGGIVGVLFDATVKDCRSAAAVVSGIVAGGIVGMGRCDISGCVTDGPVHVYNDGTAWDMSPSTVHAGGIVGTLFNGKELTVSDCVVTANADISAFTTCQSKVITMLTAGFMGQAVKGSKITFKDCYNLSEGHTVLTYHSNGANVFPSGAVALTNGGMTGSNILVLDGCYSVKTFVTWYYYDNASSTSLSCIGTVNEANWKVNAGAADGYKGLVAANSGRTNGTYLSLVNYSAWQLNASSIMAKDAYIKTMNMKGLNPSGVAYQGCQLSTVDSGTVSIRFVSTVDKLEYAEAGILLTAKIGDTSSETKTVKVDTVYETLNGKADGVTVQYKATDFGAPYLMGVSIGDVPADVTVTFTVRPYTVALGSTEKTLGAAYTVTLTNGVLTAQTNA